MLFDKRLLTAMSGLLLLLRLRIPQRQVGFGGQDAFPFASAFMPRYFAASPNIQGLSQV